MSAVKVEEPALCNVLEMTFIKTYLMHKGSYLLLLIYRIRSFEAGTTSAMLERIKDSCGGTKSQVNAWGWLLSAKRIESDSKSETT